MNAPSKLRAIVYEGPGGFSFDETSRYETVCAILDCGYEAVVSKGDFFPEMDANTYYVVLEQFPSAPAVWQERIKRGVTIVFETLENNPANQIPQILDRHCERAGLDKPGVWKPWFPVIDYGRCANCLQCLSFCLFSVYGIDAQGKIKVQNPSKCKTDCPACSRVCPEAAIVFPKYKCSPINGGDANEDVPSRENVKVDLSSLLSGNLYETLRNRNARAKSRFSAERDEEKALEERKRCLKELQESLDIPDDVLNSLPGMAAMQAKSKQNQ